MWRRESQEMKHKMNMPRLNSQATHVNQKLHSPIESVQIQTNNQVPKINSTNIPELQNINLLKKNLQRLHNQRKCSDIFLDKKYVP